MTKKLLLISILVSLLQAVSQQVHLWVSAGTDPMLSPVLLVKPGISGFEPAEGDSIGQTWTKDQVKPVVLVTPGIGGFQPSEGNSIGNTWSKDETLAVVLVEPSANSFVPLSTSTGESGTHVIPSATPSPRANRAVSAYALPSVIETQIEGDFEGWEGETIVKTVDGHIWQQSAYHYEYHYAFMPKVLIFKTDGVYEMKVDGTDQAVAVTLIK